MQHGEISELGDHHIGGDPMFLTLKSISADSSCDSSTVPVPSVSLASLIRPEGPCVRQFASQFLEGETFFFPDRLHATEPKPVNGHRHQHAGNQNEGSGNHWNRKSG